MKKYAKPDSTVHNWAGPAAAVKAELFRKVKPGDEKTLRALYEVLGVLETYPPEQGVVVRAENPGTARQHFTVRPCCLSV